MKILVYGINFSPELTGIGKYTGEMVEELSEKYFHEIKVITAPPYYPNWKIKNGYNKFWYKKEWKNNREITRCPLYVPEKPRTLTRLLHLASFSLSSLPFIAKNIFWKPDIVIVIAPSFFCAPSGLIISKLTRAKSILHIQDYELDAMFGLGMVKSEKIKNFAHLIESFIMKSFNTVSTISYSMLDRAHKKGVNKNKTQLFPNWVDTEFITPKTNRLKQREKWGIKREERVILYSGNLGEKQGLEMVISAADQLKDRKNIRFIIVGQGANKDNLKQLSHSKNLTNILFKDLVPYNELPYLLAMADIHLVVQKKGAADAVLPSKLTSILSAGGHSLITAEPNTELGILCQKFPGIAECVEPENINMFMDGLTRLLNKDTTTPNNIARGYAVKYLNKDSILAQFDQDLHSLVGLPQSSQHLNMEQKDV